MRHFKAFLYAVILFTVFILIVLGISTKLFIPSILNIGNSVKVPQLVGQDITIAKDIISQSGFTYNDTTSIIYKFNRNIPNGIILSQNPKGDKIVKRGGDIELVVSEGAEMVVIPSVVEQNYVNASSKLKQIGLEPIIINKCYGIYTINTVARIEPESGNKVLKGSRVKLYVESDIDNEYLAEELADSLTIVDSLSIIGSLKKVHQDVDKVEQK